MAKSTVLVTGATGFVASYIISELLKEGFSVRGTAREGKIDALKAAPIGQNPDFSVVQVDDIITADLTEALKGVNAIIHVASPLAGHASPKESVNIAVNGDLNVLRSAAKAGISKVILTSSIATTMDPDLAKTYQGVTISRNDWGSVVEDDIYNKEHDARGMWVYVASKILAEKAAWKFAAENPSIDLATINPPFIYGSPNPDFPSQGTTRLGVNIMLFSLINGKPDRPLPPVIPPHYIDVRDVAKAHVRALGAPSNVRDKRFIVTAGYFHFKDVVEYLAETMPELKPRLPSTENAVPFPGPVYTVDSEPLKEYLGIKQEDFLHWKPMVTEIIKSMLAAEGGKL
ncbi:hypothetical protein D9757_007763 [Collybiopsis confluens]|uniref:NAD-dependent epimerase/dehydratase domain-containing protein n=1 Tax=Collybiopsis confluens TaxID=2823264 RepID=A0A8H5MB19_9AGAR|nr:hypothetical protein D9757_011256 [Collybiopsis confluens]KAF5387443.1 hypothetical protein D9757_007763 [Collybiopsis confluens]